MKKLLFLTIFIWSFYASSYDKAMIKKVFPKAKGYLHHKVKDTISDNPINILIVEVVNKKNERLGFYREVNTTTGCNSACLPIEASFYYSKDKRFIKILSKIGLSKKDHKSFTEEDYEKLNFILEYNPSSFKKVTHPKDMVDVLTGATKPAYINDVVKEAAYSSLRLNLYNQDTLKKIKGL